MIIPGVEEQPAPEQQKRYVLRPAQTVDRWQRREQELVTQRRLLERLRYKQYVRSGTLGTVLQTLGDFGRSRRGVYLMLVITYLYLLRWMR